MNESEKKTASDIYHSVSSPALYASKGVVKKELENKLGRKISPREVQEFLLGERSFTQYRSRRKHFPRRRIQRGGAFETLSCDLG